MPIDSRTEARVIELVDHVVAGGRCEDDTIDCKRQLDAASPKQARKIAGMLNAARFRPTMWIIGLDENAHQVITPADEPDLANWLPQIQRHFEGIDLDMQSSRVHTNHGIVTVLQFDSSRPPYVINNPDGAGSASREVPWRTGTSTKTATRAQLLSLLVDAGELPDVELISPTLTAQLYDRDKVRLDLQADLYFYANAPAVLPSHRWSLRALADDEWPDSEAAHLTMKFSPHAQPHARDLPVTVVMRGGKSSNLETPHPQGVTVRASGLIVNGSDSVRMHAWATLTDAQARTVADAPNFNLTLHMPLDRGERAITHRITLRHNLSTPRDREAGELGRWSRAHP
ncbi:hypothetical protein [Gordonia amicalis]|uniref:Schlafen AlbA-2 domain-containing protein n=1 Tax=Gordonia amicalis TaxID=89053 RepID=A0ABU4DJX2_9ACTN|nr:hypothetical protein [Gordonia amicalis]MDV6310023.1 hypothetical protein [Gordonia amicalis]